MPLITTMAVGLAIAFVLGLVAHRLRMPLIAGYLAAGVIIGPFTPGYVADQDIAAQLAEMGVILLMFGVGLHFSIKDLMSVKGIAVPGALAQIAVATAAGALLGWLLGWGIGGGLLFGLALSVASTVVLLRALQERDLIATEKGRIAVGWLIVEDLVMVLALVLIPPLAGLLGGQEQPMDAETAQVAQYGLGTVGATILVTFAKVAAFVAIMLVVGRRVIPWTLEFAANTGQRELFRLAVLAIALGVAAGAAAVFGVSLALGAFFAGMVMAGSTLSAQALKDTLPFRDAFAVLFFVSVGMLFDPTVLWQQPFSVMVTVLIIIGVKSAAAFGIVRAFGHDRTTGLTIAAALAQIGEFSFILIVMGVKLDIVPTDARDLVVAGALISILVNPLLFRMLFAPKAPVEAKAEPEIEAEADARA
ncbi:MAG: cation:proton antiporter [Tabrizicola sp.]|uniref:cation:proton antiporter domain-containing protein n=1 Tax=Tabrizicola sp. TaxID=2005166 RepID=UPI0027364AF9|nr:cation:proton antiporter [Tabrizicola sp.]MDP3262385.1 cation:proton antiporter [Tabrizicola sp.]MDP3647868.1 cation:proton antiporter [Paracoccaceae bacterium]MDZ4066126.1 cation:proton antiporter [Tabrizicola sp.]